MGLIITIFFEGEHQKFFIFGTKSKDTTGDADE
jgi:hypothetical protein